MSSSGKPPCWWHLVQALKKTTHKTLAEKFEAENSKLVPLSVKCIYRYIELHDQPVPAAD